MESIIVDAQSKLEELLRVQDWYFPSDLSEKEKIISDLVLEIDSMLIKSGMSWCAT
jgi:hypothetical protein